jgi:hypothetical protein
MGSWRVRGVLIRFKWALTAVAMGSLAVGIWQFWQSTKPVGRVEARIVLGGAVCRAPAHVSICRRLASGGQVVIFGPIHKTGASPGRTDVTLASARQTISMSLAPGTYAFGFWIKPPYQELLPNFGIQDSGTFVVHPDRTTELGRVQPGDGWVITGD